MRMGWLEAHGWSAEVYDNCWLDCPAADGHLKRWHHSEICLCEPHARRLEEGYLYASYAGAPLPPESVSPEWPWRRQHRQLVEVV